MTPLALTVNGRRREVAAASDAVLLDVLRGGLGPTGAQDACRRGECGARIVLLGGRAALSCVTLAALADAPVETVEGLAEEAADFRAAMADPGGVECGDCTSGVVVRAVSLLHAGLPRDDCAVDGVLAGKLSRYTGYRAILAALRQAETAP